ncbi:MAG: MBL fold metallo-hydrolase [bacterium]|nr:MAG: MBL fold metallo-hydrolase [bacterium]
MKNESAKKFRERIVRRLGWTIPVIVFAVLAVWLAERQMGRESGEVALTFCGAAREVGGSSLLVETGETRFVVDCGVFGSQGRRVLPPEPESISFVVLTHAHLDHCGLIPELYAGGFHGEIYCTAPTAELVPIMLGMQRGLSREKVSRAAFDRAVAGCTPVPFDSTVTVQGISFTLKHAGHLLGAVFVECAIATPDGPVNIVISGDLGSGSSLLLPPLDTPERGEYVVMESTYGGTIRTVTGEGAGERHRCFAEAVGAALERGGDVLIPAFALGRTQEVCATIDLYRKRGIIPSGTEVYVDSPSARSISRVYRRFPHELSRWAREFYGESILDSGGLREVRSKTSLKVHARRHEPVVFVSSSGDLEHASSPRHLMRLYGDPRNLVCFVGWLAPLSLGARLAAGESSVMVRHRDGKRFKREWISPVLEVRRIDSFSGHADQLGLLEWLGGIQGAEKVFLVHGELEQARALAEAIRLEYGLEVVIPKRGERVILVPHQAAGAAVHHGTVYGCAPIPYALCDEISMQAWIS